MSLHNPVQSEKSLYDKIPTYSIKILPENCNEAFLRKTELTTEETEKSRKN